jgi:hypothetical protein
LNALYLLPENRFWLETPAVFREPGVGTNSGRDDHQSEPLGVIMLSAGQIRPHDRRVLESDIGLFSFFLKAEPTSHDPMPL